MELNFFTLDSLPTSMVKLGDNIKYLYHTGCRTTVNNDLVGHKVDGMYVQFGADEYNQIVVTFTNQFGVESDKFVVRARKLATVVDAINNIYNQLISKKNKTMRKDKKIAAKPAAVSNEVSNVTPVASVNCSCSADVNMLGEFIIQQHAHSGYLYEASKFMDVSRLYQTKSCGAVSNVVFDGDNITIEGGISISFCVAGMNQPELCEQVNWALQTIIERSKQLADQKPTYTEHKEPAAADKAIAKGKAKSATTTKLLGGKVGKKAVERFNETVSKGVDALELGLKGLRPSASSQSIRCFLKKSANESKLKLPDTSGETLAKFLSKYNIDLFHTLCESVDCKIPPFLQIKDASVTSSSKSAMRA